MTTHLMKAMFAAILPVNVRQEHLSVVVAPTSVKVLPSHNLKLVMDWTMTAMAQLITILQIQVINVVPIQVNANPVFMTVFQVHLPV
jgi:hypothetical protein